MEGQVIGSDLAEIAEVSQGQPFDVVIVGGGSAGLTASRTLAESGRKVAVLEAGPAPFLTHLSNTEIRFSRDLVTATRERVTYSPKLPDGEPFGKNFSCLGGRGLFWNGAAPRFRSHDFNGWPLAGTDLEPHYQWAEREFRVTDRLGRTDLAGRLIDSISSAGFGARPGPFAVDLEPLGNGHLSAGIASILAPFFRACGAHLVSGDIALAIGAQVRHVLVKDGSARGVAVVDTSTQKEFEVLGRSVVLAAGGVESIRIAALSDVEDPGQRIGKGIQDHIFYRCYFEGHEIYDPETRETAVVHIFSTEQETEQWEIHAPGRLLFSMDDDSVWKPAPGPDFEVMVRSFAATEKRQENWVEVAEGGLGSATIHFEYTDHDERLKERMRLHAARIGEAAGLELSADRFFTPGSSYHEAGGLDMGTDARTSVTLPDGRFHGLDNLVCVDASCFPKIGATNPHLTIVAISRMKNLALASRLN